MESIIQCGGRALPVRNIYHPLLKIEKRKCRNSNNWTLNGSPTTSSFAGSASGSPLLKANPRIVGVSFARGRDTLPNLPSTPTIFPPTSTAPLLPTLPNTITNRIRNHHHHSQTDYSPLVEPASPKTTDGAIEPTTSSLMVKLRHEPHRRHIQRHDRETSHGAITIRHRGTRRAAALEAGTSTTR